MDGVTLYTYNKYCGCALSHPVGYKLVSYPDHLCRLSPVRLSVLTDCKNTLTISIATYMYHGTNYSGRLIVCCFASYR